MPQRAPFKYCSIARYFYVYLDTPLSKMELFLTVPNSYKLVAVNLCHKELHTRCLVNSRYATVNIKYLYFVYSYFLHLLIWVTFFSSEKVQLLWLRVRIKDIMWHFVDFITIRIDYDSSIANCNLYVIDSKWSRYNRADDNVNCYVTFCFLTENFLTKVIAAQEVSSDLTDQP